MCWREEAPNGREFDDGILLQKQKIQFSQAVGKLFGSYVLCVTVSTQSKSRASKEGHNHKALNLECGVKYLSYIHTLSLECSSSKKKKTMVYTLWHQMKSRN